MQEGGTTSVEDGMTWYVISASYVEFGEDPISIEIPCLGHETFKELCECHPDFEDFEGRLFLANVENGE